MKELILFLIFLKSYALIIAQPYCVNYNYGALGSTLNVPFAGAYPVYQINVPGCNGSFNHNNIVKFIPPVAGKYELVVYNMTSSSNIGWWQHPEINLAFRTSNGLCNYNNYVCIQYDSIKYDNLFYYTIDISIPNIIYDILFIPIDSFTGGNLELTIKCAAPSNLNTIVGVDNALVTFNCNCPNSTYIEYGPAGFMPGSDSISGGGTVIPNISSPYNLTGLNSNSNYDIYLRSNCVGYFSKNSLKRFRTLNDCINPPIIDCSSYIEYKNDDGVAPFIGHWSNYGCGYQTNNSIEKIYQFTPTISGTYTILFYTTFGWVAPNVSLYYKEMIGTCDENNWICIADISQPAPQTINWGPLTAGTTYLLLLDGHYTYFYWGRKYFRIDCSYECSYPEIYFAYSTSTTSIIGACNNCTSNPILEYGLAGFIPGNDSSAGIGGTVIYNVTFPFTINNLTPGASYDVYVRNNCGSPNGFSINSNLVTFTTQACPFQTNITSNGPTTICNNTLITLSGSYAQGVSYQWQLNGNNIVGAINNTYQTNIGGNYSLLTTDSCGNSTSNVITVTVSSAPSAAITASGPTTFCTGSSVTLNANTGTGLSYQWQLNGNNINGATTATYNATSSGNYSIIVSNSCGNSVSNIIPVTVTSAPGSAGTIIGPDTICKQTTHTFSVNPVAGATNYVWSVPPLAQIVSGAGTNSIVVKFKTKQGNVTVKAANQCGAGPLTVFPVTIIKCFSANNAVMRMTITENEITIYPNPSQSSFTCLISGIEDQIFSLSVFDYAGRIVEVHENLISNNNFTFGNNLSAGFYFVEINTREKKEIFKIVKLD